jgi:cyclic pyranopterin phosphate synthase
MVTYGDDKAEAALFNVVEAELNGRCNRRCSYCPVATNPAPTGIPRFMSAEVFEHLVSELARLNFGGRFSHHFLNEPLLRPDLEELVREISNRVQGAYQVLYTNGDRLTESRYASLRAAGVSEFVITSHSGKVHPERENQQVHFPSEMTLSNRGGYLRDLPSVTEVDLGLPCFAPSEMLIVGANGDVLLCHEDATRTHVMGNVATQPLDEIWCSDAFVKIRKLLTAGQRAQASDICRVCTNFDLTVPQRAIRMWRPEIWQGRA